MAAGSAADVLQRGAAALAHTTKSVPAYGGPAAYELALHCRGFKHTGVGLHSAEPMPHTVYQEMKDRQNSVYSARKKLWRRNKGNYWHLPTPALTAQ